MSHAILIAVNLAAFCFAALYFWQALRVGRFSAMVFVGAIFYALGVELSEVSISRPYYYNNLFLMVGSSPMWVPLGVCLFWACYLFACMRLTDLLALKWHQRPAVDALIAVSIDFVGDPVASASRTVEHIGEWCHGLDTPTFGGLGAWIWCVPEESATWFSVPFENYFAWFLVVSVFSFALRYLQRTRPVVACRTMPAAIGISAAVLISAIIVLLGVNGFSWLSRYGTWVQWLLLGGVIAWPILILFAERHRLNIQNPIEWRLVALPAASVTVCFGVFVWLQIDGNDWPQALVQLGIASLVSLALIFLPFIGSILKRG